MTSQPFAIPSRQYINRLALTWLTARWWLFALPLLAVSLWAIVDIRAVYVGLVLIFLLYPLSLTLVWFNYALSPQSIRAITDKKATVTDEGLQIDYLPKTEDCKPLSPTFIPWNTVHSAEQQSDSVTLILGKRLDDRLSLPSDAFSAEAWSMITDKIADRLPSPEML